MNFIVRNFSTKTDFKFLDSKNLKIIHTCQAFIKNGSRHCRNGRLLKDDYCHIHQGYKKWYNLEKHIITELKISRKKIRNIVIFP